MRKSNILLFSFIVIVIAFSAIRGSIYPSGKNKNRYVKTISQEYLDLFTPEMQKQFVDSGILSTTTTPSGISVSSIVYIYDENGKGRGYSIELFKVGLKENNPLEKVIEIEKPDKMEYTDDSFTDLSSGGFDLKFKPGKNAPTSTLKWSFKGDIFRQNIKRDDLLYYDVRFNYFTLKFDNGTEFWAKRTMNFSLIPLSSSGKFIFIKKKSTLYMLFFEDIDAFFLKPNDVLKTINQNLINPNGNND